MISSLLFTLAIAGQFSQPTTDNWQPTTIRVIASPRLQRELLVLQAPALDWGWHQVAYEGRIAWVWGHHLDPHTIRCYQLPDPIPQAPLER
jgi:hypothetical protein